MRALIVTDIQNDFMPGGALAVKDADELIPVANELMDRFDLVIATQDWHPRNHGSFASQHPGCEVGDVIDLDGLQQILWPDHCIQNTAGAELAAALEVDRIHHIVRKGADPMVDSYSGFFDNGRRRATDLADYLKARDVEEVDIMGLTTDYCVKFTALDCVGVGFFTRVITDGCRGLDCEPGDVDAALADIAARGIHMVTSEQIRTAAK